MFRPNVPVEDLKICFVCGEVTNKMKRSERYNHISSIKKKGKKDDDSDSNSDDSVKKSKKKTPQRSSARAPAGGSRQTRNQNPKTFAASLCKVMELPDSPDEPFVQIFSRGHYCNECMARVKDAHAAQLEMERLQARMNEVKVDLEIDFSKHLERLPARKNFYNNNPLVALYEEDIKLILDFNGTEKKKKPLKKEKEKAQPKRERRQAAINTSNKMKRKRDESDSEEDGESEEEVEEVKVKEKRSKRETDAEDTEVPPENSTSSGNEKEEKEEQPADSAVETEVKKEEKSPAPDEKSANNGSSEVKQEEKPEEIVKVKKDPNLKCPHCPIPRYFNIAANLEEHITKCHNYNCDACDKTFQFEVALRKHKAHAHVHKTTTEGGEGKCAYICGFCDQVFLVKKYLEDHLDRHQEAKPLNCHQCGRGFSRKESLQKAFQIYKGESVEACNRCGKNLNLKDYIEHNKSLKQ